MPPFVSASAIVLRDGCVLAMFDAARREPVLPGGHLRWRESPEDGCRRETHEETGIDVAIDRLVGVYSGVERTGEPGIVRVVYLATACGGALLSSGEGEAAWMPLTEFDRLALRDGPIVREVLASERSRARSR